MSTISISIPHQIGREEAKRRLNEFASNYPIQTGNMPRSIEQHWDGDTLHFVVREAVGRLISGTAHVTEQTVNMEILLPWMLSLLAGALKKQIEQRARDVLGHQNRST